MKKKNNFINTSLELKKKYEIFYEKNINEQENNEHKNLHDIKELFTFLEKNNIDSSYYYYLISNSDFENLQKFYRYFSMIFKKYIIPEYNFKVYKTFNTKNEIIFYIKEIILKEEEYSYYFIQCIQNYFLP